MSERKGRKRSKENIPKKVTRRSTSRQRMETKTKAELAGTESRATPIFQAEEKSNKERDISPSKCCQDTDNKVKLGPPFAEKLYNEASATPNEFAMLKTEPLIIKKKEHENIRCTIATIRSKHENNEKLRYDNLNFNSYSTTEFLKKIRSTLDSFYYNDAEYICMAALEKYPKDYDVLWQCAKAYIDIGRESQAIECLNKCVYLKPTEDYEKYICLGRLQKGKVSLDSYSIACDVMQIESKKSNSNAYSDDMLRCYCAMAEIYLNSLKSEEDADVLCEKYIKHAIIVNGRHPLGYQTMAKFKLHQRKLNEAKNCVKLSIDMWLPTYLETQAGVENLQLPDDYPSEMRILSYEERLDTVSLLIKLKNYEQAEKIIRLLLIEDDQVVEIQYYYGWLLYLKGDSFHGKAKYRLEFALMINEMSKTDDEDVLANIVQLLEELEDVITGSEDDDLADIDENTVKDDDGTTVLETH